MKRRPYNPDGHPVMSAMFVAGIVVIGGYLYANHVERKRKSVRVVEPIVREKKDDTVSRGRVTSD